jgi:hypothetical protein
MLVPVEPFQHEGHTLSMIDASVAVSNSVAIRLQPVVENGDSWQAVGTPFAVVGTQAHELTSRFLASLLPIVADVVTVAPIPAQADQVRLTAEVSKVEAMEQPDMRPVKQRVIEAEPVEPVEDVKGR